MIALSPKFQFVPKSANIIQPSLKVVNTETNFDVLQQKSQTELITPPDFKHDDGNLNGLLIIILIMVCINELL